MRRKAIIICEVLQHLSNNVKFKKFPYMAILNDTIEKHADKLRTYMFNLSVCQ